MTAIQHWADVLELRPELIDRQGKLAELQMSLYDAAFHTAQVPYREVDYYGEITQPTPGLVGFMAEIARRIGSDAPGYALFHLDQGMGGGKSHALVGLYHLVTSPRGFFKTELGAAVAAEAENRASGAVDVDATRLVVISADHVTPGAASAEYGPATTLFERFLWSLFDGDEGSYDRFRQEGPNKAALRRALEAVGRPVLILLDELMDYAQLLSDAAYAGQMPGEQAFLNNLMDTVNSVPHVACVLVMIRSDYDERGYNERASGFRDYIDQRIERNGTKLTVTDAADFQAILRRRLFKWPSQVPAEELGVEWVGRASDAWTTNVFERLPSQRALTSFPDRAVQTYPFHPDLMALVRDEWSTHAGFQRVRSTVRIFAAAAYHWSRERTAGKWAPDLIGVGDIPLDGQALDAVLTSGLLRDERSIQNFRQVARLNIVGQGGEGKAIELDEQFLGSHPHLQGHGQPCVRTASALFLYSLVARAQGRRGATKAEMLAAVYEPDPTFTYTDADEAHNLLTEDEEGLGSLDAIHGGGGNTPTRYLLVPTQTLRAFYRQARARLRYPEEADDYIWERTTTIVDKGRFFDQVKLVPAPDDPHAPLSQVFASIDERNEKRLVVLDPHRWSLLNGKDNETRHDIEELLGLGDNLRVSYGASCVVVCVNTYRRDKARKRAAEALAYQHVATQLGPDDDLAAEAQHKRRELQTLLDRDIRSAFQHYAFQAHRPSGVELALERFDSETKSALSGNQLWDALDEHNRATQPGELAGSYLPTLIDLTERRFTVKEIVTRFWQDPRFPLVPSEQDLRRALFEALTGTGPGATGTPLWEIASETGEVVTIASPDAIPINSMEHVLRPAVGAPTPTEEEDAQPPRDEPGAGEPDNGDGPTEYRRYTIRLPSRSIANDEARDLVRNLLAALDDALDEAGSDAQLIDLSVNITAAEGTLSAASEAADQAGAQWHEEDEF